MTWGVVMVSSRWRWVWVRSGGSNHTNGGEEAVAGAPTKVDELRQPAGARRGGGRHAAPTRQRVPRAHARTRSSRQLRGSQFEYSSSLVPAELVRNRHHREVALHQVTTGRRGGRRRLVVDSCATRWREKLVGAAQGTDAGRATLEWSRDYGRTRLEARARLRSSVYVGLGSLRCQTAGHQLSYS